MERILEDKNEGLHVETRRESVVIYTDFGDQRVEIPYRNLDELETLIAEAKRRAHDVGIATCTDTNAIQEVS